MRSEYADIPIIRVATRCGLEIDARTLGRTEVRARCPFCGDKPRDGHFYMNTEKNLYFCFLCGAKGTGVSLYANLRGGMSYGEAARELLSDTGVYAPPPLRKKEIPRPEQAAKSARERHAVYTAMLASLSLAQEHLENLRERGFSDERIRRNMYRSLPEIARTRLAFARMLSDFYDLSGIPGFYRTDEGAWTVAGEAGLLIPVRDKNGHITGMQIRSGAAGAKRKYRWLSSGGMKCGTGSGAPIHVTGDTRESLACITEGPLKGDAASFLSDDALFVCPAGVNILRGLKETLLSLDVKRAVVAFDADRLENPNVGKAAEKLLRELSRIRGLKTATKTWDPAYKGIDDYYLGLRGAAA
jgi:hypothetical protein